MNLFAAVDGDREPLKFKVAPHIVEDLGLNLYTNLPKVLVEFVANAYDADATFASILIDHYAIASARSTIKAAWLVDKEEAIRKGMPIPPLATRTLSDHITITVEDNGHGMSRDDLAEKFLVAGRRRRGRQNTDDKSPSGRLLMGRKGLGKLAGFGVAKTIQVISRANDKEPATRITLRYDQLVEVTTANEIPIEEEVIEDGAGISPSGTRIVLSSLIYEPLGAKLDTIEHRVADQFSAIPTTSFEIKLNNSGCKPTPRTYAYCWPDPEKHHDELVEHSYTTDDDRKVVFQYRLRFVEDGAALAARDRGIKVYVRNRLAASPSLLDADTNMHGFRMTDYLDGIAQADFLDGYTEDYIATDRQTLRWESPLLAPMHRFLGDQIKVACAARQKARDAEKEDQVSQDTFTMTKIEEAKLTQRESKVARKIAIAISSLHKKGFDDDEYKTQFSEVVDALGRGEIMAALYRLANIESPPFAEVASQVSKLTVEQLEGYYKYARARLDGISALRRIVEATDFKSSNNEKELHVLLKDNPWLINAQYFEFLTSDKTERTVYRELEKALAIGSYVSGTYDPKAQKEVEPGGTNERPDLVFLLGDSTTSRIVVVELKAPNTPLYGEHYRQLQGYVRRAEKWLSRNGKEKVEVTGILIGSFGAIDSRAEDVEWLEDELKRTRNEGQCRAYSIGRILEIAQDVHREIIKVREIE